MNNFTYLLTYLPHVKMCIILGLQIYQTLVAALVMTFGELGADHSKFASQEVSIKVCIAEVVKTFRIVII